MSTPAAYNFPDAYRGDGLRSFSITLQGDDAPIDLTGCLVRMQMMNTLGQVAFTFGTDSPSESILTVSNLGVITFPEIKTWEIPQGEYKYDLQVTDPTGFVTTYLKGSYKILNDITR